MQPVEQRGPHCGKQPRGCSALEDHDLEQPVLRVAAVGDLQVELDAGEVDQQDGDPIGFQCAIVELDGEPRYGGRQVLQRADDVRAAARRLYTQSSGAPSA